MIDSDGSFGELPRLHPLQLVIDERTSEEIVARAHAIDPDGVTRLRIAGDGLMWEWEERRDRAGDDATMREIVLRIGRFLSALVPKDVFAIPTTLDLFSYVVRHGVLISLRDGTTFGFHMTLLGQMHPAEPPRRALENLFSLWPPRLGAFYSPPYGPQPVGATVPRFFRVLSEPPDLILGGPPAHLLIGPPETSRFSEIASPFSVQSVGNWYLRYRGGQRGSLPIARLQRSAFLAHGWHLWAFGRPLLRTSFVIGLEGPFSPELQAAFDAEGTGWAEAPAWQMRVTYSLGDFPPLKHSVIPLIVDPGAEEILEFVWGRPDEMNLPALGKVGAALTDEEIHAEFGRRAAQPGAHVFRTFRYYERTPFPP